MKGRCLIKEDVTKKYENVYRNGIVLNVAYRYRSVCVGSLYLTACFKIIHVFILVFVNG